ncbi:hypothetical protein LNKW23_39520 [Paralimibaculum aggregatum]|uniref:Uncharacterized protein n=1 Tax=Paralimibaculum aggregatum TaxID=3036245 RepID=A0ABQ6LNF6_9RHOB|nr:hypothetical protein LNKW23_39520 [Limibaculum sp. NKW23]
MPLAAQSGGRGPRGGRADHAACRQRRARADPCRLARSLADPGTSEGPKAGGLRRGALAALLEGRLKMASSGMPSLDAGSHETWTGSLAAGSPVTRAAGGVRWHHPVGRNASRGAGSGTGTRGGRADLGACRQRRARADPCGLARSLAVPGRPEGTKAGGPHHHTHEAQINTGSGWPPAARLPWTRVGGCRGRITRPPAGSHMPLSPALAPPRAGGASLAVMPPRRKAAARAQGEAASITRHAGGAAPVLTPAGSTAPSPLPVRPRGRNGGLHHHALAALFECGRERRHAIDRPCAGIECAALAVGPAGDRGIGLRNRLAA